MLHQKETERCSYSRIETKQLRLSKNTVGFRLGESHAPAPFNPCSRAVSLARPMTPLGSGTVPDPLPRRSNSSLWKNILPDAWQFH